RRDEKEDRIDGGMVEGSKKSPSACRRGLSWQQAIDEQAGVAASPPERGRVKGRPEGRQPVERQVALCQGGLKHATEIRAADRRAFTGGGIDFGPACFFKMTMPAGHHIGSDSRP